MTVLDLALPDLGLHPWWYLGRAGGFVAYTLLFVSMILGIGVSSRIFDGLLARAWFFELHKFVSLLVVAVIGFHAFVMLPDPFAGFSVADLLVPFWSHLKPAPLALGILSFYISALLALSFYATKWIGQKSWRLIHYLAFFAYLGGAIHGAWAGSDTDVIGARVFYILTGMSLVFLVCYRIVALKSQRPAVARKQEMPAALSQAGKVEERRLAG
jgi:predicted ferric reductase